MSLDDAFAAIRAGTLSRLALPDAYSTSATYVTAPAALYQNGLITQVPHDIQGGRSGPAGTSRRPLEPFSCASLNPLCSADGVDKKGARIATAEKAIVDYFYLGFGRLPEVEVPSGWRWETAHGFADLVTNAQNAAVHAHWSSRKRSIVPWVLPE